MKYMLLIYTDEKSWTDGEREKCYAESTQLCHDLQKRGQYVSASPLQPIASELGLIQSSDTGAVDAAIDALIAQNPKPLADYKAGKQAALGALVGMVMKGGKGLNAKVVQAGTIRVGDLVAKHASP